MIEIQAPIERAILVGAPRKGSPDAQNVTEHLDELARLADTAGADVVGRLTQQVPSPHPATLIGEGKVEELRALVEERGSTLVIFDEELSPVQGANLERCRWSWLSSSISCLASRGCGLTFRVFEVVSDSAVPAKPSWKPTAGSSGARSRVSAPSFARSNGTGRCCARVANRF